MSIVAIDHINIATERLAETRDFFVEVLGLEEGPRPHFNFDGHWLYAGGRAIVHLQSVVEPPGPSSASALNHFAFEIAEYDALRARLDARGVGYAAKDVPGRSTRQIFLFDPNGVRIELNYRPPGG